MAIRISVLFSIFPLRSGSYIHLKFLKGLYGLKHDTHDVTKLVDEQPLDELLRGTFDCPSLCKDKGKKAPNVNEGFLSSIRKACSILFPKPGQSQNMAEMDNSSNKKMSGCQMSSSSVGESSGNGDKGQSCTTDVSSCQKVCINRIKFVVSVVFRIKFEFNGPLHMCNMEH